MKPRIWMLVVDGAAARIYQHTGHREPHTSKLELVSGAEFVREKSKSGKNWFGQSFFAALGRAPHGVNTHENHKRLLDIKFLRGVIDWLVKQDRQSAFEKLVVAAPSRTLGDLREIMPPNLRARIISEIDADLTKAPVKLIEERFMGV